MAARAGLDVVVVDMDPQGSLSIGLGALVNATWLLVGLKKLGSYRPEAGWLAFAVRVALGCGAMGLLQCQLAARLDADAGNRHAAAANQIDRVGVAREVNPAQFDGVEAAGSGSRQRLRQGRSVDGPGMQREAAEGVRHAAIITRV